MCLGIPGQLVEIVSLEEHRAIVEVDGVRREVNIGLVMGDPGGIAVGDWVLIHVGFAMTKIDEEEAASSLEFIKLLGSVYEEELEQFAQEPELVVETADTATDAKSAPAAHSNGSAEKVVAS
ncbi:MAG: HypC/HybG/HupF family hydrogenase formation chaperone [Acidimicrobiales bacterium]